MPAQVAPDELARDADTAAGVSDGAAGGDGADADKDAANGVRHPTTVRDFIQLVCRDLIVERHGMLVESDGSMCVSVKGVLEKFLLMHICAP